MANPAVTLDWESHFEDAQLAYLYKNKSRAESTDFAVYLLERGGEKNIALAEELIRWSEDQFVVWDQRDPGAGKSFVPAVLEQWCCYAPVSQSYESMIHVYAKAHKVTGKAIYLAKAESIANSLMLGQQHFGGREYPTWVSRKGGQMWLNCSAYPAVEMGEFARYLDGIKK
jgi:maltose/maltodextrin transport system substrate-binding protein